MTTYGTLLGEHHIRSGPRVDALREALNQTGLDQFEVPETGAWDPDLTRVVRAFQTFMGADVDGVVGPETRELLVQTLQTRGDTIHGWDLFVDPFVRPKIARAILGIGGTPTGILAAAVDDDPATAEHIAMTTAPPSNDLGMGDDDLPPAPTDVPWLDLPVWEGATVSRGTALAGGGIVVGGLTFLAILIRIIRG